MRVSDLPRRGSDPATNAEAVTPNDSTVLNETRALFVGTGGNMQVDTADGDTTVFNNIQDGTVLAIAVTKVYSINTTASNIVAMR